MNISPRRGLRVAAVSELPSFLICVVSSQRLAQRVCVGWGPAMAILRLVVDDETVVSMNTRQYLADATFISIQTVIGMCSAFATIISRGTPAPAILAGTGYTCGLIAFAFTPSAARCAAGDSLIPNHSQSAVSDPDPESSGNTLSGDTLGFGLRTHHKDPQRAAMSAADMSSRQ